MTPKNKRQFYSLISAFVLSITSYTLFDLQTVWKWAGLLVAVFAIYLFICVWLEIWNDESGKTRKETLIELVVYLMTLHIITGGVYFLSNQWIAFIAGLLMVGLFSARLVRLHS